MLGFYAISTSTYNICSLIILNTKVTVIFPSSYTVFGLGNKTYEHYNEMARFVDKRLAELGANRVYKKGEGDDDAK